MLSFERLQRGLPPAPPAFLPLPSPSAPLHEADAPPWSAFAPSPAIEPVGDPFAKAAPLRPQIELDGGQVMPSPRSGARNKEAHGQRVLPAFNGSGAEPPPSQSFQRIAASPWLKAAVTVCATYQGYVSANTASLWCTTLQLGGLLGLAVCLQRTSGPVSCPRVLAQPEVQGALLGLTVGVLLRFSGQPSFAAL